VRNKFLASLIGLFVMASSVLALNGFVNNSQAATIDNSRDCDSVAIIRCGAFSEAELRTDAAKGDVPKVFSAFGISQSELNGFVSGVVWEDGHVTVGDKTVATGAMTAGRWNNPTSDMVRIAGTERAYKMSTSHFVTDGQTAFVKMVNGQFQFAVIKTCGNPVSAKPVAKPPTPAQKATCDSLVISEKISRQSFRFQAKATASGGAKITGYRYDFGDGKNIPTSPHATTSHTYASPGTYTARVTATATVNGQTKTLTNEQCTVRVTVDQPPKTTTPSYACKSLTATPVDDQQRTYQFTVTPETSGGATLRDADFDFGDGSTKQGVTTADLDTVEHTYARDGSFTTTATLHFNVNNTIKNADCKVTITVSPEVCPLDASLPKDSPDCAPCPIEGKEDLPKNSPDCVETPGTPTQETPDQPQVLPASVPSTGPAELAAGGIGVSSIAGAGYYWRISRRKLIDKLMNRSK
jgi:PKD repeat protein